MSADFLTNMNGNTPTVKVIVKLIIRAARALSLPFATETRMDRNMNSALTSRA
ncbi:unknown [Alistipes sp. CAG:514]|nr:unknown [Alistipes sp. CAG:514]